MQPCIATAREAGAAGSLLLDLTVTASSGVGHISSTDIAVRETTDEAIGPCLLEAAERVQFDWPSADGQSQLRYPVRIGSP